MAEKETKLSIVVRTVDKATAKIQEIGKRIDAATRPIRDFRRALGELREKSGLDDVIGGFRGVGGAITGILGKVAMIGGVVSGAVAGLGSLVDEFDNLGDLSERLGVSVDFIAQLRFAAERSGASVEQLDSSLQTFTTNLGRARAGTGRMAAFLKQVSPALLQQLKAAKSNEEAFGLLADAMAKLQDPAKRAALAQMTLGDAALGPLMARGAPGIKVLTDRYAELAGSQEGAAAEAGKVDDSFKDLKAATDGVKAALVQGLGPALKVIVDQLANWFKENRGKIAEWAASLGKKLPGAIMSLVGSFRSALDTVLPIIDAIGGFKTVAIALAAIIVGPLISAVYGLGVALLTTPVGWIVTGIAAIAAGATLLVRHWDGIREFFVDLWDWIGAKFGWARDLIMMVIAPIIAVPAMIIEHWDGIKVFFVGLWDGITSVFERAWGIISGIVDKVIGAVTAVTDAIGSVLETPAFVDMIERPNAPSLNDVLAQSQATIAGMRAQATAAHVTVDFANAPRGTRVKTDPQNTADVDLSVGYQMLGIGP